MKDKSTRMLRRPKKKAYWQALAGALVLHGKTSPVELDTVDIPMIERVEHNGLTKAKQLSRLR
jgi:hypothetical protein